MLSLVLLDTPNVIRLSFEVETNYSSILLLHYITSEIVPNRHYLYAQIFSYCENAQVCEQVK